MLKNVEAIIEHTHSLNLLFVEDDQETRDVANILLGEFFQNIYIAEDGLEALEILQEHPIDLILTDIQMPYLDGLKMIEKIRLTNKNIPIIVLSAHMEVEYFIESIKLKVNGYLLKPIDMQGLVDVLDRCITSIKLQEEVLKNKLLQEEHSRYLQCIIDSVYDPIMVVKEDYSIDLMSNTLRENIKDENVVDVNNPKCYEVLHKRSSPCDGENHPCPLKDVIQTSKSAKVIHTLLGDTKSYIEIAATPLLDAQDNCIGIIESFRDISQHLLVQDALSKEKKVLYDLAHHDFLTGLANRILFEDRLSHAIAKAKRDATKIAIFYIDLNKFKEINDTLGHKAGDFTLKSLAKTMQKSVREEDTLARIGGDEFSLIVENADSESDIIQLAKKILYAIEVPIPYEDTQLFLSASIGISIYPDDAEEIFTLLKYADKSMYDAKRNKSKIVLYKDL